MNGLGILLLHLHDAGLCTKQLRMSRISTYTVHYLCIMASMANFDRPHYSFSTTLLSRIVFRRFTLYCLCASLGATLNGSAIARTAEECPVDQYH
jgi:hypothetical protein